MLFYLIHATMPDYDSKITTYSATNRYTAGTGSEGLCAVVGFTPLDRSTWTTY